MTDFVKSIEEDIAIIRWDCKDKSMNTMTIEGMETFSHLVLEALGDSAIKGIIFTSGKKDFSGGMDLSTLESLKRNKGDNPASKIFDFTIAKLAYSSVFFLFLSLFNVHFISFSMVICYTIIFNGK